jgi:hypothetical protein
MGPRYSRADLLSCRADMAVGARFLVTDFVQARTAWKEERTMSICDSRTIWPQREKPFGPVHGWC